MNKVVIKHAVRFYNECWRHRNDEFHDEAKQRNRFINWYEKLKKEVESHEPPQVKLFVRRSALDLKRCSTETIRTWIHNVKELQKKVQKLSKGDIRRYFEV